jgi:hypothetical protein
MLLLAGLILVWTLASLGALALCAASRRGDEEMALARPVVGSVTHDAILPRSA